MVILKTAGDIAAMREAGRISSAALREAGKAVEPGISTLEIDSIIRRFIEKQGAKPSFLGYGGFPASACISVNNVVIHGIPGASQILREGDIVSIDVGAFYKGWHGDNAYTFPCGKVSERAQALMDTTREALYEGIRQAVPGNRTGDIGNAVQRYVEARSYSVVRDFVGHGVGAKLHEDPNVPNYGTQGKGVRLLPGMVIAIEPMVNEGTCRVKVLSDGWTTVTSDGKLSAHFEHTVAITSKGPVILTEPDEVTKWTL